MAGTKPNLKRCGSGGAAEKAALACGDVLACAAMARMILLKRPNALVKRRRSPLGRRVPTLAMKMAKPWPVSASA